MKRIWIDFFFVVCLGMLCYILIYIFFMTISSFGVEGVIGVSFIFLLVIFYLYGRRLVNKFLVNRTKQIYLKFVSLLKLLVQLTKLVFKYINIYIEFLRYNFEVLRIISKSFMSSYKKFNLISFDHFCNNYYLNILNLKKINILNLKYNLKEEFFFYGNLCIEVELMYNYEFILLFI